MKNQKAPSDDSLEFDAVWKLLEQSPVKTASARFVDDTVRAARLIEEAKNTQPWWSRLLTPAPLAGLAGATAAFAIVVISWNKPSAGSTVPLALFDSPQAIVIQDIAETETLIAAADHLEDFSDRELVSLIGF